MSDTTPAGEQELGAKKQRMSGEERPRRSVAASDTPDIKQDSATPLVNPRNTRGPSRLSKRLAESAELRQEVKRIRTESELKSETISAIKNQVNGYRTQNGILQKQSAAKDERFQREIARSIGERRRYLQQLKKQQGQNAGLQEQLKKHQDNEVPKNRALAKLLCTFDELYHQVSEDDDDDEQEQDEFLEGIKADLGKEVYDEMLALGKKLDDQK